MEEKIWKQKSNVCSLRSYKMEISQSMGRSLKLTFTGRKQKIHWPRRNRIHYLKTTLVNYLSCIRNVNFLTGEKTNQWIFFAPRGGGGQVGTSPSQPSSGSKRPAFLPVFSARFNDKKVDLALKLFAGPLCPSNKHQELPISV